MTEAAHDPATAAGGSGATPAPTLWGRVVAELAELQDASPAAGFVVNPVVGTPYAVDTCCAAAVFVTEHRRSGGAVWRARAEAALDAARSCGLFSGIEEPFWDAPGWSVVPGSLTATGIALDAYLGAARQLGQPVDGSEIRTCLDFVSGCRTATNGFAHNALDPGRPAPEVQNATASALNLLGQLGSFGEARSHPVYADRDAALARLRGGQTATGFWPYHHPGRRERLRAALRSGRPGGYGGYGDLTHHLMTLYFAAGAVPPSSRQVTDSMLVSGWAWIRQRLVDDGGGLSVDWSGDPTPTAPQNSNARDTNAYFLLLGALPRLRARGVVDDAEAGRVAEGLLRHVGSHLLAEPGEQPCIVASEGPTDVVANLLPMFEQSAAWKGRLLAELV